ncbi:hypothetical protein [Algisphaera agarilytica]|uniref:Uncharacterized protein n=1 Tax=Algisphaera agarilytica TaxID=1385975 RepID=A0A7X0H633_9BACT|nr:hypothetical protein [Algisphaera agarilytica]MBB6428469.1 hypothetical protein [Algisphaera agarilytica]
MGIAFGLFALIPCMLLVASIVGLIWIWVRVGLDRRDIKAKGDALAQCGACGYPTRGAVNLECSECGADLREVGIVTPSQRRRPLGPVGFILFWTLCYPVPALTLAVVMISIGPKHQDMVENVTLNPVQSGEYVSIDLNDHSAIGAWAYWFIPAGSAPSLDVLDISLQGQNNNYAWLEVDAVNMTYDPSYVSFTPPVPATSPSNPGQPATAVLDQSVLLAWMKSGGVDVTKPEVIAEADELLQIIQAQPTQGLTNLTPIQFSVANQFSYSSDMPKGWWIVTVLLALPVFWGLGIVLYFLVRRRPDHLPPPPTQDKLGPARFAPPTN